jgi:predicted NAD/FAD-binding protein
MRRIAVIGSGVAGLSAAWSLSREPLAHRVTLFEAGRHFGGHANTVDLTLPDAQGRAVTHGVDTGFLVFNHRTYPLLRQLFTDLGVETAPSDMSFSVQSTRDALEWSGTSLSTVFAQRGNLLRPRFLRMLADLVRFNRLTTAIATQGDDARLRQPIADFLDEHRFSTAFREWYFLPMIGCIWSCPTEQMLRFPVGTMIRFCHNHGLLQVADRPQWYTVAGGSRRYVEKLLPAIAEKRLATPVRAVRRLVDGIAGVRVTTDHGTEAFDEVIFACHSDQALALLGEDASVEERRILGAIRYHDNRAVLHTDTALLPRRRAAWAAWNYEHAGEPGRERAGVCLHYLINQLQPLPFAQPVVVSLNPVREPRASEVLAEFDYAHPVFDQGAVDAQRRVPLLQGRRQTWFCGAWTGYGFHEDGLRSGLDVARQLAETQPAPIVRREAA